MGPSGFHEPPFRPTTADPGQPRRRLDVSERHLPVRPDLDQLKHQAKDLLRDIQQGDPSAIDDLRTHHPEPPDPVGVKLADAQLTLARSYGIASWPRLVLACRMTDAIWLDDADAVR